MRPILCGDFIDGYNEEHKARSVSRILSYTRWSSDGKHTPEETFTEKVGIRQDYSYQDDDGQRGESSKVVNDARGILRWFRDQQ